MPYQPTITKKYGVYGLGSPDEPVVQADTWDELIDATFYAWLDKTLTTALKNSNLIGDGLCLYNGGTDLQLVFEGTPVATADEAPHLSGVHHVDDEMIERFTTDIEKAADRIGAPNPLDPENVEETLGDWLIEEGIKAIRARVFGAAGQGSRRS